jgi:regulator of extracellular matrix RemA (YlzA/DUF370 family)
MNVKFINAGFGNNVATDRIIAIVTPDSNPIKRLIQDGRDRGVLIDATQGRRTQAVIVTDTNQIILSALRTNTLATRINADKIA